MSVAAFTLAIAAQVVLDDSRHGQSTEARTATHFNESLVAKSSIPTADVLLPPPKVSKVIIGKVSYYNLPGNRMSNGDLFDPNEFTVAMLGIRFKTRLRITNLATKAVAIATVTDRGPYVEGRVADVSPALAEWLGFVHQGVAQLKIEILA